MKNLSILFLLLFISLSVFSQTNYQTLLLTSARFKHPGQVSFQKGLTGDYKKLKTGGIALIAGGVVMTTAGLFLMIDGSSNPTNVTYTTNSNGQTEPTGTIYSPEYYLGELLTGVGIHAIAGGFVMKIFAQKKMKKNGMSFNYNPLAPTLTYRF